MVCFGAIKDKDDEGSDTEVDDQNPSYDDLLCASEETHIGMQKLLKRNNVLK